ncbi:23S rRNA (adenine(2030)-N(6))-methyltransferase RlmJ [Neptuniibacter sp. CAU 1671]|uniref:23S rRNA (adenine(2030)-N(6))-methyltransferase RlmJ n=1 Tax=Neptuniibacter sp. CAU 1671 TaxID=3032593 RepID=UPI0023DA380F|nr:23S rRNA (adenine(2030)-N(6))-methyltransferase RlmJ [Neptuniibacter sp. CAU 1671]MDF2180784.1 23S rRNA (adenine(2030)-N(6))-methyltransferase RlmJ [Neptuniibacter sp. CAU 1671]
MLSYRHAYHAGNFADVLKHIVEVEILYYLTQKDKAFHYIDTHAGGGLYTLKSSENRRAEYLDGVARLSLTQFPQLADYFAAIDAFNAEESTLYPGSPAFAQYFLRPQDRSWLFELHSNEVNILRQFAAGDARVVVQQADGFKGALAQVPPVSRRGLVLIDPPYELKEDYDRVVKTLQQLHRRFATGVYAIWYPVVERSRIDQIEKALLESGIGQIQLFELSVKADTEGRGMTGSGMIVVNPPWKLFEFMSELLPELTRVLAQGEGAAYRCLQLVD